MLPQFEFPLGPLLKSGLGPLARYGTHQETLSGRPEQKYLLSDSRLEWPAEGPLFKPACFRNFQIAYPDRSKSQRNIATTKIQKRCKRETS